MFLLTAPHAPALLPPFRNRAVAQLGRAPVSGAGGRGFESRQPDHERAAGRPEEAELNHEGTTDTKVGRGAISLHGKTTGLWIAIRFFRASLFFVFVVPSW